MGTKTFLSSKVQTQAQCTTIYISIGKETFVQEILWGSFGGDKACETQEE